MKSACRWAITGLLCLCGVFGCVQLPTRGLFDRHTRTAMDEPDTEESNDSEGEAGNGSSSAVDWNRDFFAESRKARERNSAADSKRSDPGARLAADDFANGQTDLSNHDSSSAVTEVVEAPSPIRQTSAPPAAFVVPPNARKMDSNSTPITGDGSSKQNSVVLANHESVSRENSSGIELTTGQRQAKSTTAGASNPWDRFRGLTNSVETGDPSLEQHLDGNRSRFDGLPQAEQPEAFTTNTPSN